MMANAERKRRIMKGRSRSLATAAISFLVFGASSSLLLLPSSAVAFVVPPPHSASSALSPSTLRKERRIDFGRAAGGRRRGAAGTATASDDDDDDAATPSSESMRQPRESSSSFGAAAGTVAPRLRPPVRFDDPDSVARRRLVLSLLASASLSPLVAAAAADDVDPSSSVASTTTTTATPPAGGNGGNGSSSAKIIKPPLDKRTYDTFVLPNGLKVLLCSDPSSTTSAVAMNVHVGACSDPVEVSGLAHFCEHMLFLGTELYPEEDSFSKFLSSNGEREDGGGRSRSRSRDDSDDMIPLFVSPHELYFESFVFLSSLTQSIAFDTTAMRHAPKGGTNNAFTDSERTVYYFEMDGSIDNRFSEALVRFGSFFSGPLFTESATGRELNAIDSEHAKNLQSDVFRLYELEKDRVNSAHP